MLVLSRLVGERIIIGDDVVVEVVEIRGDRVKLGFSAPCEVSVHREEIYERILAQRSFDPDADCDSESDPESN